ncbi:MAG: hypothetical protein U9N13_04755 [Euryarchaeota archaeon]|nr:hypothetical protein [Euryarchaeota archaeon]
MKYIFQDSTELPLQRDIVDDLQTFVQASREILPIENSTIEKNDEWQKLTSSLKSGLIELERSHKDMVNYIERITEDASVQEVLDYRNAVMDTCNTNASSGVKRINSEIEKSRNEIERELDDVVGQVLTILNPLFEGGVYGTDKKYSARLENGKLQGVLTASLATMEYQSELTFDKDMLTVREVSGNLFLPTWTRSGLIHKEDKVKMEDVSDLILVSFDYDGHSHVEAVFESRRAVYRFRVIRDDDVYRVYYDDREITADSTLLKSIKIDEITSLVDTLISYMQDHIASQKLRMIQFDGKDAIRSTEVFDCLKLIAEQYADIILECGERGYAKGEITIKMEEEDGTRTEKYVTKTEIFDQLSEIGSEGLELAGILGVEGK